jgi:hypothetical protein
MENYQLILNGEQVKNLLVYLEDLPFKYATPIVNLVRENIKEVEKVEPESLEAIEE